MKDVVRFVRDIGLEARIDIFLRIGNAGLQAVSVISAVVGLVFGILVFAAGSELWLLLFEALSVIVAFVSFHDARRFTVGEYMVHAVHLCPEENDCLHLELGVDEVRFQALLMPEHPDYGTIREHLGQQWSIVMYYNNVLPC